MRGRKQMWFIGVAIFLILMVLLSGALYMVQQNSDDDGAAEAPTTGSTTTEEPTADEPTEDPTTSASGEVGASAGFTDATCEAYDLTSFETAYGAPHDPTQNSASSNDDEGYALLNCSFYGDDYAELIIAATGWREEQAAMDLFDMDRSEYEADTEYTVTDLDMGDAGFRASRTSGDFEEIEYRFVQGSLEVSISAEIMPADHDLEAADAMLADVSAQTIALLESYT
ncbi:hypothetical protein [Glycomyces tenuis]|uniref:hypothetical protein n=1 Tax=Glycomyces tenuis TaxID=58116 RepID=UPI0012DEBB2B|nr:hypothetical protein [Glycomyces tenuis]